jgi:drug/metabolite transporter (DMT)-like permease
VTLGLPHSGQLLPKATERHGFFAAVHFPNLKQSWIFGPSEAGAALSIEATLYHSNRLGVLVLAGFAAVYILWGSTYLAIALAVQTIPPFLLIGVRSLAAGVILLGFAQVQNPGMPPVRAWASAAASGVLLFGGCHGTLAYAEKYVSSGLAAVMLATIPFWIVLIKFVIRAEDRPRTMTLVALIPGLDGVALFALPAGPQGVGPIAPEMVVILLASALMWAAGSIISQRQSASISAITSAGMQLLGGGGALLIASSLKAN